MRLQIISDGTPARTHVVDRDTGEHLENWKSISWWIDEDNESHCYIHLEQVPIEAEGEGKVEIDD